MRSSDFTTIYFEARSLHDRAMADWLAEIGSGLLRRLAALGRFAQLQFSWTAPREALRIR